MGAQIVKCPSCVRTLLAQATGIASRGAVLAISDLVAIFAHISWVLANTTAEKMDSAMGRQRCVNVVGDGLVLAVM